MAKYEQDARELLEAVGGKENINAVTHCVTRMRFVLDDDSKADVERIEKIPSAKGTFTNAGQFQVIIGNDVPTFYNDFSAVSGIEGVSKEAAKSAAKNKQNWLQRLIANLAEIFTPLLPAIIVGGLILGFRNILEGVEFGGATIVSQSEFWNGVNHFLWLPGEAIFHFLPVGIAWSVTRKMGTTQILGIVLGITLVSPQLLNAYSVNATTAAEIAVDWSWNFGAFSLERIGYQAQVIPAMAAAFLLAYLELFWRKRIPEAVSMIFVPFLSLIPAIIAAHAFIGPIGWQIGQGISWVVNTGLTSSFAWLFGGVFGALYAPLVITGLHHTTLAIDSQLIADFGSTNLWPMIALSNIAQGAAVFAVYFLHKSDKKEGEISLPSTISAWLGVTEPAMFGINLKYVYPFVAAMIGSGIAGMVSTLMQIRANAIGVGGLPGILAIRGTEMLTYLIPMLIALVVPFVLTMFFRRAGIFNKIDRVGEAQALAAAGVSASATETNVQTEQNTVVNTTAPVTLVSPLEGTVKALEEAVDPVFGQGMMGQGVVIEPTVGELVAPFNGTVTAVFPSKHAVGMTADNGAEVLMHIGMDTVKLDGEGFETLVAQGDKVTAGQALTRFDIAAIQAAGYPVQTPVIITNPDQFQIDIIGDLPRDVKRGDDIVTTQSI
jgi:PTS system trehalose-specific IIC component